MCPDNQRLQRTDLYRAVRLDDTRFCRHRVRFSLLVDFPSLSPISLLILYSTCSDSTKYEHGANGTEQFYLRLFTAGRIFNSSSDPFECRR